MTAVAVPAVVSANPFVGPRPLSRGQALYGRDREVRELLNLLLADRIVLCYSPSGAGKTSLIHAGLIPKLEAEGFQVLPIVRLSHELPDGPPANRYVASALTSLGAVGDVARGPVTEFVEAYSLDEGKTPVLVFDQFEEVLSLDPTDADAKREFFAHLGAVLRDRRLWVLLAMREDYLAALDPYLHLLPNRLSTRFRLDLLGPAAAQQVVTRTALSGGRTFAEDAAAELVTELSRLVDGRVGPYIEPVQLQVVCRQIWERVPLDQAEITKASMGEVGDLDHALASYYAAEVAAVATATNTPERALRDWFDQQLVTGLGFRGQAQSGPTDNPEVLRRLQDSHLVRPETRRGTTWYELAHDRLVRPVQADNQTWRERHLSAFQRQAELWDQQDRRDDLLVLDEVLDEGIAWSAAPGSALTPVEEAYLASCRKARAAQEREARSVTRTRVLAVVASIGLVVALVATLLAVQLKGRAERAKEAGAELSRLAFAADAVFEADPNLGALLALRALEGDREATGAAGVVAQDRLYERTYTLPRLGLTLPLVKARRALLSPDGSHVVTGGDLGTDWWDLARLDEPVRLLDGAVKDLALSPDGSMVVTAGADGRATVVRTDGNFVAEHQPSGATEDITEESEKAADPSNGAGALVAVAFSPVGTRVAVAGPAGLAVLWDFEADPYGERTVVLKGHRGAVLGIAFSPDGTQVVTAGMDGWVRLWGVEGGGPVWEEEQAGRVYAVAFSPDGSRLVAGGEDGTARMFDRATRGPLWTADGHDARVNDVAFSLDGSQLASASDDGSVRVWDAASGKAVDEVTGTAGPVTGVGFSPDGSQLVLASADGAPAFWKAATTTGHTGRVYDVEFSRDGTRLVTASADTTAAVWPLGGGRPVYLVGHDNEVNAAAFDPAAERVVTASDDRTARVWDVRSGRALLEIGSHEESVYDAVFSPDGGRIATASQDGRARVWDAAEPGETPLRTFPAADQPTDGPLNGVAFSPDGQRLAVADENGTARVYNAGSGAPIARLTSPTGGVQRVAFSPDGRLLAGTTEDRAVLWDVASSRLLWQAESVLPLLAGVAFSPDGRQLLTGDGAVRDVANGAVQLQLPRLMAWGAAFGPDGSHLATSDGAWQAHVWDSASGKQLATLGSPGPTQGSGVRALAEGPDRRVASVGFDGSVVLRQRGRVWAALVTEAEVLDVGYSPDGKTVVTAGGDGSARLWASSTGELLAVLGPPPEPLGGGVGGAEGQPEAVPAEEVAGSAVIGAAFQNARTVVTAQADGTVNTWDVKAPVRPRLVSSDDAPGFAVALSDDGRWVASQRGDGRVTIFTVTAKSLSPVAAFGPFENGAILALAPKGKRVLVFETGRGLRVGAVRSDGSVDLRELKNQPDEVSAMAISDNGKLVAAAGDGIVVWEAKSGDLAYRAPPSTNILRSVALRGNGRAVLAGSERGGAPKTYTLVLALLREQARARLDQASRELTEDECREFLPEQDCATRAER